MKKLHVRVFFALLLIAFAAATSTHLVWSMLRPDGLEHHRHQQLAELASDALPTDLPSDKTERRLRRYGHRLGLELTLLDQEGRTLAGPRRFKRPPDLGPQRHRRRHGFVVALPDGRKLAAFPRKPRRVPPPLLFLSVGLLVFLLGSYVLARGITGRLSRLKSTVDTWGTGAEQSRARVEGKDEVAALASTFNAAADRIDELVANQQRMLASASHELRTPMTRIRLASELIKDAPEPNKRQELVERIESDLVELDGLVDEILASARLSSGEGATITSVDLAALCKQELPAEGVTLVAPQNLYLNGDERLLRRLIRNLVDNALRYGGDAEPEVSLQSRDDTVVLRVSDTGPGIDEADHKRIFEPFFRAARHHEGEDGGVGIGLYLAKQIVDRHNGTIDYRRQGSTSIFEVVLPA